MSFTQILRTQFRGVLNYCGRTIQRMRCGFVVYSLSGEVLVPDAEAVIAFLHDRENVIQKQAREKMTAEQLPKLLRVRRENKGRTIGATA